MHKAPKSEIFIIDNQGKVSLTIRDPWHARWEKGTAEIDQLSSLGNTILQNESTLNNQLKPPSSNSQHFSWLALVQQGVNMLSLTEAINFTNCFLCASLNEPPLAAVPLLTEFNLSQSPMGPDTTLTGIPLFKAHSQNLSLCYRTTDNYSCNTTVKVRYTYYAPLGKYFWCNGTLTKVINASLPLPSKGIWASRVSIPSYSSSFPCPLKQTSYLPPRGIAAGTGSGAIGYSVTSAAQLEDKLRVAIEASAASLASLQ
ncbi:provirus ancestral Env polyprotein [Plecturocebus cupreus]